MKYSTYSLKHDYYYLVSENSNSHTLFLSHSVLILIIGFKHYSFTGAVPTIIVAIVILDQYTFADVLIIKCPLEYLKLLIVCNPFSVLVLVIYFSVEIWLSIM